MPPDAGVLQALTRRQREIYNYLAAHPHDTPSLDELCTALGLSSRGSMHKHVAALIDAGLVEPMGRKQRGVRLIELPAPANDDELPLYGYIAAGRPIEALDSGETVAIPPTLRSPNPCYVLRVRGDSMMEDGILDGDLVVVEHRTEAHNGEIVVALIDGHEATLKRILQRPGEIVLCPANSAMEAMHFNPNRVAIQGVVVGQMRSYL
ncbi:MAG: transcriptional repressor LexA [Pseudomonadota bacterium]